MDQGQFADEKTYLVSDGKYDDGKTLHMHY